jgi:outer membrane protein assembly factor BamB
MRRNAIHPSAENLEARLLLAGVTAQVLTYHNDNARTGENLLETTLKPSNVNASTFGKKFTDSVDGAIYAQPLYVAGLAIPGQGIHNVVFVATEHDSVYAFDADTAVPPLWHVSFIDPAHAITTVPSNKWWQSDLTPEVGITGTPVIDPGTGTLYVAAKTQRSTPRGLRYAYTLHALDISTGAEKLGGPVEIHPSVLGRGTGSVKGNVRFQAKFQLQRPALLLDGGVVYVAFGSLGDFGPYHGWVVGYAASNLAQVAVFNDSPNSELGGIWMDGDAPASDGAGNIYVSTGNAPFQPAQKGGAYGDSVLRLTRSLKVADYFAPQGLRHLLTHDLDLDSGGVILVPEELGGTHGLVVGGGKDGTLYAVRTASMGHHKKQNPNVQAIVNPRFRIFSTPAYFNGSLYINAVGDVLKRYSIVHGRLVGPLSTSAGSVAYPGANLSISADGAQNPIVWSLEMSDSPNRPKVAVLHAYDADDVNDELYDSDEAGSRDQPGTAVKFAVPTVASGKVYVGTQTGLAVYGLLD